MAERFPRSTQTLDFYHASQHLWAEPLLHQLRHGGEACVLATLGDLSELMGEPGKARLMALEMAQRNGDWDSLWPTTREQR